MLRFAHITDLHIAPLPAVGARDLAGKRLLAYLSWQRKRKAEHRSEVLDALKRDLAAQAPDHICVTGDLTNLGLPAEFEAARAWLEGLGPADRVSVVPGNHDAMVTGAMAGWPLLAEWMRGDDGAAGFPFVRRRGPVDFIGLSSAVATAPTLATGRLGPEQRARLKSRLEAGSGRIRVLLLHHPLQPGAQSWRKHLSDRHDVRAILRGSGAELVLHGHMHEPVRARLPGPAGHIAVRGAGSASALGGSGHSPAHYHLITAGDGTLEIEHRHYDRRTGRFHPGARERILTKDAAAA